MKAGGGALRHGHVSCDWRASALISRSLVVEEQRAHGAVLDPGDLAADDLSQHLWELHTQSLIDEGVEAHLEQPLHHLRRAAEEQGHHTAPCWTPATLTGLRTKKLRLQSNRVTALCYH